MPASLCVCVVVTKLPSRFGASGLGEEPGQGDWHLEGRAARGKATGSSPHPRPEL